MANLQARLNSLMAQKNINAIDIERKTGLSRNTVYSILYGSSKNPSANNLQLIAKALDINLEALVIDNEINLEILTVDQIKIFSKATSATINILIERNLSFSLRNLTALIKEVYEYALKKQSVDNIFIDWIIDKYHKP
ncbi:MULTISPECIES: helix-turn-helix domain-containing protein [unclassified Candidatus Tisiphia]|jgi:transcriptional regulator with XRE-family HTH domain|uniref:helix-turn-helix domain-containing protein n=1 Tax=unclassified Candidatus Tisiphia TaxID=2996318 RepID=UPI001E7565A8|nr:helix-turn-helix transcriptional regulator [Rickettsia sp.]UCM92331.1 MAG: helix-turn-helix transcriptional regulator [Rickettsia endosymbiont of Cimex lectularius]